MIFSNEDNKKYTLEDKRIFTINILEIHDKGVIQSIWLTPQKKANTKQDRSLLNAFPVENNHWNISKMYKYIKNWSCYICYVYDIL